MNSLPGIGRRQRSLVLLVALAAVVLALPACDVFADEPPGLPGAVIQEFEVAPDGDYLVLPVTIEQRTELFLVGTSCPVTLIDPSLKELFPALSVGDSGGEHPAGEQPIEARIGDLRVQIAARPTIYEMRPAQAALGFHCTGILGMDVLREHIVQIDFDAGRLRFLKAVPEEMGYEMAIAFRGTPSRLPTIPILIPEGALERCVVSTVDAVPLGLTENLFEILEETNFIEEVSRIAARNYGEDESENERYMTLGRLESVRVGHQILQRALVVPTPGNIAGLGFLSRFLVTLDFPAGKMYLEPGKRFDLPELPWTKAVTQFQREERGIRIESIASRTRAAKIGLLKGDVVVTINSHPALRRSDWMFGRLLSSTKEPGEIEILRDGAAQTLRAR